MDHEVVPRPYKVCDRLLNSYRDHFGLHQGKNIIVTLKFEVSKRHIVRLTLSIDMVQRVLRWERQKMCSYRKGSGPWQIVVFVTSFVRIFLGGREDEDKRMVKLFFYFIFSKLLFLDTY